MPRLATGRSTKLYAFRVEKSKGWVWERFVRLHKGKTQSEMLWEAMWAWILANDPDLGRGFFATQAKSMVENLHCAFRAGVIEWDGETIRIVEAELAARKKPSGIRGFTADYREPEFRGDIDLWNQEETVENIFHAAGMPWDRRRIIDETEARASR